MFKVPSDRQVCRFLQAEAHYFGTLEPKLFMIGDTLWLTVCELENGPVEIVDLPINSMVDLSTVT